MKEGDQAGGPQAPLGLLFSSTLTASTRPKGRPSLASGLRDKTGLSIITTTIIVLTIIMTANLY